ncbi:MAG: M20/M25/M40 family metallo-hydrolase [Candidatus Rokubacteria bacterium]|nr:M20/M25/M40 family metallo-hydrolase [Candidatus Rokubacteria bacterium]
MTNDAVVHDRLVDDFLALVRISSPSRREREVARWLTGTLEGMGVRVDVDDAGARIGGDTGNLLAQFPGTAPDAPPLLLCAHMDTVVPCEKITPVRHGDVIRTDGTSVLGGDDKAGIAAILEAVRVVRERGIPHGPIDVLFTVCEEQGLIGAKHFDVGRLRARAGVVLDCDGVDELILQGPAANRLRFTVHGLEAHAGLAPEEGISAIKIAGQAIAGMTLGRIDEETTANLGVIEGGLAGNIVPNRVVVRGETRSRSDAKLAAQTRHMVECFEHAVRGHRVTVAGKEHVARVEAKVDRDYDPLNVAPDSGIARLVRRAVEGRRRTLTVRPTGVGCDANVFNGRHGLEIANLGCGMRQIHTVNEWIDVNDLVATATTLVEMLRLNTAR